MTKHVKIIGVTVETGYAKLDKDLNRISSSEWETIPSRTGTRTLQDALNDGWKISVSDTIALESHAAILYTLTKEDEVEED